MADPREQSQASPGIPALLIEQISAQASTGTQSGVSGYGGSQTTHRECEYRNSGHQQPRHGHGRIDPNRAGADGD